MSQNATAMPRKMKAAPVSSNQDHSVHQVTPYQVICVIILVVLALLFTFPLYWIITGSFKGPQAVNAKVPVWFPLEPTLVNYQKLFEKPALLWMYNTVFMCVAAMALTCIAAAMGGYALAKKRFTGRAFIFTLFVCAMALPKQVILIPLLKEMAFLGIHNTLWAVILPTVGWPFGVFLMKQFSENIPSELLEEARIDGAGEVRIAFTIFFPLCLPVLATIALFYAIGYWNNYFNAVMLVNNEDYYSLQMLLFKIQSEITAMSNLVAGATHTANPPKESFKMATSVITMGPIIILYPFLQKYFVKGMVVGAVKG